ncbi:MAG: DUF3048 domain-containing protein [Thermoflexales bacterium]|nr:DUF3048 domain-containing protein [Thermoflexales bacterium]
MSRSRVPAWRRALGVGGLTMLLAACGSQPAPEPTRPPVLVTIFAPAPTATPQPAAIIVAPTATLEPHAAGPVGDVAPAPISLEVGVNPFTGLRPPDPTVLQRRPLLIKVANTAEVRPQSGLGSADVVVEHLSEGSITRFTALYLTYAPEKVGSVRSCRLIDIELPHMFDAALVCSGTSPGVKPFMRRSWAHQNNLTMISDFGPFECPSCPMFRTRDRVPPHNLFANAPNAWRELDKRNKNTPSTFRGWLFTEVPPQQGKPTTRVEVAYRSGTVSWQYDPSTKQWTRALRDQVQVDALNRQPIVASNVVVLYAHHQVTDIQEDVTGARSIQIQVWGEGPLRVFRDGVEIGGRWVRDPTKVGGFEFRESSGARIPLKPGATWIEVVPITGDVPVNTR